MSVGLMQELGYERARLRVLADACSFVDVARRIPWHSFPPEVRDLVYALVVHVEEYRGEMREVPVSTPRERCSGE